MKKNSITIISSTMKLNHKRRSYLQNTCGFSNAQIIEIENPGTMSLTQAYQKGLDQAENDIVIFVHDDVKFITKNWGRKIVKSFNNTDFGIIGLAGTTTIPETGRWWDEREKMVGIVKHSDHTTTWENKYSGAFPKDVIPTVNVDGLFIAIDKTKIKHEWDTSIPGFHFYDVDFSFSNYLAGVKVGVTTDIRVIHYGLGETNEEWDQNRINFIEKYKDRLPAVIIPEPYDNIVFKPNIKKEPKVKLIIIGKSVDKIKNSVNSIIEKTTYKNYDITVGYSDYDDKELTFPKSQFGFPDINVIEVAIDNFSIISNQLVDDYVTDHELVVFLGENTMLVNDVITYSVDVYNKRNDCGTISTRIYNPDNTINNVGYDMYNLIEVDLENPEEQPNAQLIVNLRGQRSHYSFDNTLYSDVVGGTKDFIMIPTDLFKKIKFNENYKEAFQDLELHVKSIQNKKTNFVLGYGAVKLQEELIPTKDHNDDLNQKFLQYLQTVELRYIKDHIKEVRIPKQVNEEQQ